MGELETGVLTVVDRMARGVHGGEGLHQAAGRGGDIAVKSFREFRRDSTDQRHEAGGFRFKFRRSESKYTTLSWRDGRLIVITGGEGFMSGSERHGLQDLPGSLARGSPGCSQAAYKGDVERLRPGDRRGLRDQGGLGGGQGVTGGVDRGGGEGRGSADRSGYCSHYGH